MATLFLLLLIGLSVSVGCYIGQKYSRKVTQGRFSKDCFTGINYVLNEQPDKAVDVFVRLLQIDTEAVEVHLALGSLFRKRGEISRSIKIHQNLIARPQLSKEQRIAILLSLAKDYFYAGLFDRAEKILIEIVAVNAKNKIGLHYLIMIYQQQKKWLLAIKISEQLMTLADEATSSRIIIAVAHYHCELAEQHMSKKEISTAMDQLKVALKKDINCVRANLLLAKILFDQKAYQKVIYHLKQILQQDKIFFKEALPLLLLSYEKSGQLLQCVDFLSAPSIMALHVDIAIFLSEYYATNKNDLTSSYNFVQYLNKNPSIKGLQYLLVNDKNIIPELTEIMLSILKNIPNYRCIACGFKSQQLSWFCPACQQWNQIKPVI